MPDLRLKGKANWRSPRADGQVTTCCR